MESGLADGMQGQGAKHTSGRHAAGHDSFHKFRPRRRALAIQRKDELLFKLQIGRLELSHENAVLKEKSGMETENKHRDSLVAQPTSKSTAIKNTFQDRGEQLLMCSLAALMMVRVYPSDRREN